jgi:hypothetical protein
LEIQDGVKNMKLAAEIIFTKTSSWIFKTDVVQSLTVLNTNQMQKSERKNIKNWPNCHQNTIFRAGPLIEKRRYQTMVRNACAGPSSKNGF